MHLARLKVAAVMGFVLAGFAACGSQEDSEGSDPAPDADVAAAPIVERAVESAPPIVCPAVTPRPLKKVTLHNVQDTILRFDGPGRDHRLWIFRLNGTKTITMTERGGTENGVDIEVTQGGLPANKHWAILFIDSSDCPAGYAPDAGIVRIEANGDMTAPDEGLPDPVSKHVVAALTGNSAYVLSAPVRLVGQAADSTGASASAAP